MNTDELFSTSSEMARLMRDHDWSATPMGPSETWPRSMRATVRIMLTSRFAMWMGWGPDLTFFYNDAYGAMTLGAKHPWALGRPSREVWTEIWPDIGPRTERVLRTGEATWDEELLLFLERSGYLEETYHTFSYSPVADDAGTVAGLLCVVTEVTERVISERRMALLRDIAAASSGTSTEEGLFASLAPALAHDSRDVPFTLTYLFEGENGRARLACRTGMAADHPAAPASLHGGDAPAVWSLDGAAMEPDGVLVEHLDATFGDLPTGPWATAPTTALVLPIAQQGQQRAAGVFVAGLNPFRPVDDAYRSFLRLLVGQIGAGVANTQAYDAARRRSEALAEIDRAKTTFFSNVSHEFRTPLTLLLGPLDDLRTTEEPLPERMREQLDVAYRNSLRLLKLVNTLLDFSRIEAGRTRAHFEPIDLGAATADLSSTFRSAMEKAGLVFRVTAGALDEPVYVDRDMWEKIVLNLLSNAFKFTLAGSVAVTVTRQGDRAVVTVDDTGAGIPERELSHIFERFHRVDGTRGRSHEGSGIGLALVHELVKLHGGELTVESQLGRGSRFTVSLPFGHAHLPDEQVVAGESRAMGRQATPYVEEALRWLPTTAAHAPGPSASADGSADAATLPTTGRVLLVDDNADMREYARRLLAERWVVDTAANGREALAVARATRPDVVVTDVMMPEVDGFGLLRALRDDADLESIPVVMVSARAGEEARLEAVGASADDYLVKPFSARDLIGRVDAQLVKARARTLERRHAERMQNLFANAPVAIAVLRGPQHVFELANPAYLEMIGRKDVLGKPLRDALPELDGQGMFELYDGIRASGEPFAQQSRRVQLNRGAGGAPIDCYFDFVAQPLFDDRDTADRIVVVAHDVTALATARNEAESANRLKDEFLATLSHELRTPLNAVLGYIQMLRGGVIAPDRMGSVLEILERNAKHQEQLIADVFDVSRIVTGKLRLDMQPVDLTVVINRALGTVAPAALAKGVRLQPQFDAASVRVSGDPQRLQQVVWNVLSNAVKFTPGGGGVQVRLQRTDALVEIIVSDTGEGIAREFMPYLFERFRQADGGRTRAHGGLGLGLAICRHLVEAHGGRIEADSPGKGRGTTIRVQLPIMTVHGFVAHPVERAHPSVDLPASPELQLMNLAGVSVLLVDDDGDALGMASDALSAAGASVTSVANPADAISALDQRRFDVAIVDIGMPEVDGYELLERIRRRPADRNGAVPAAALTAYARASDRTRSLEAGFQMHLSKPIEPAELAAAVRVLAGDRHRSTA